MKENVANISEYGGKCCQVFMIWCVLRYDGKCCKYFRIGSVVLSMFHETMESAVNFRT